MSALITQCPHCNTSFRVSAAQLNAAGGLVRCGSCLAVFSASDNEIRIKQPAPQQLPGTIPGFEEFTEAEETSEEQDSWQDPQPSPHDSEFETQQSAADTVMDDDDAIVKEFLQDSDETSTQENFAHVASSDTEAADAAPAQVVHDEDRYQELDDEEQDQESTISAHEDVNHISLGDMRLDDDHAVHSADQDDEPGTVPPPVRQWQASHIPATPHTGKDEKVQVRKYLSSLADEESSLTPVDETQLEAFDEEPLTFVARKSHSPGRTLLFFSLNLLLLAGLAVQWLYWNRLTLEEHPRFAFLAPHVCKAFSCPEPVAVPVISALSSQQLQVRTHPRFPDALEVNFIFNNDSTTSQPFPNLELAFSDLNNRLLANRMFTPEEYLTPDLQQFGKMPPQTSVHVVLDLADPGEQAVNYSVTLHEPQTTAR